MMLTGHFEIRHLNAEETSWETAKLIVEEALPWAEQVTITAVTQPLVEYTLLAGPDNDEEVMHQPNGPMQIHFVATGIADW